MISFLSHSPKRLPMRTPLRWASTRRPALLSPFWPRPPGPATLPSDPAPLLRPPGPAPGAEDCGRGFLGFARGNQLVPLGLLRILDSPQRLVAQLPSPLGRRRARGRGRLGYRRGLPAVLGDSGLACAGREGPLPARGHSLPPAPADRVLQEPGRSTPS